ncbi:MAG: hypothetical protein JW783_11600 [Bacteroidales bacterium]|nr:hypothetical protein [Bacteroidales bacterium]MBN2750433.1 hypothetical protein [Bacteroidales bacterium]
MLDTVIKIGKLYRQAPNAHIYHEQVNSVVKDVEALRKNKDKDGNPIETTFYEVPVIDKGDSFLFDLDNLRTIEDEDKKKSLYYLNFKTSKKDAEKRYLLGDICYSHFFDKKGDLQEFGNYRLFGKWEKRSSFDGAEEIAKTMENLFIHKFRDEYRKKKLELEELIKSKLSVVLHFSFIGLSWFEVDGLLIAIDEIITQNLVVKDPETGHLVLDKYLYKTLGGITPGFDEKYKYKNKVFTSDDIISIMYATEAYQQPKVRINDIGIILLPHSDQLTSQDIVTFFEKKTVSVDEARHGEESLVTEVGINIDDLFGEAINNPFNERVKFDIIFSSIPKSPAGVYCDLIEVSNVEKSLLVYIHNQIDAVKRKIIAQLKTELSTLNNPTFSIRKSFLNILGDVTKDKKKFQFHLLKVIPQIYTDTYYNDPLLLPTFIDKVEYNIREGNPSFTTLKYDFYFLMSIQKKNNLMEITQTKSYELGRNLGIMARQFAAWRNDCPIKSFEKSYVGNLSRRISSIDELVKFSGFINEKLVIHERLYPDVKNAYLELVGLVKEFKGEKYSKHNCALGFFETYYASGKKNENQVESSLDN